MRTDRAADALAPLPGARLAAALCGALLLLATATATAASAATAAAPAGVSEAELAQLVIDAERDPATITRQRGVLERLSAAQMAHVIESTANSHFTWLYPMVLRAQDYPRLAGTSIAQLSVAAVRGGKLVPIPFQIDEFDTRGIIYIPGVPTPGPFNPGIVLGERKTDGIEGRYDRSDELVFMYRDAGLRTATPEELVQFGGRVLGAIELRREGLPPRWAYVMQDHPARSTADYVHVDVESGISSTSVAHIAWDPRSMAMLRQISPRVGPSSGQNIIDGVYGEVSAGFMQRTIRVSLNTTDNIRLQPVAVKDGPVRAVMLVKGRVFYMGVPLVHEFTNIALYEQGTTLIARVRFEVLDAAKYFVNMIKDPRFEATIDFANLEGAEVRWEALESSPERAMVDGRMSKLEQQMNLLDMPGDWLWLDSRRGWQFFVSNNFSIEPDGLVAAFLGGTSIQMIYNDDHHTQHKGDRYPGSGPRFGVRVMGMPTIIQDGLPAVRDINFSRLKRVEDFIDQLIELDERGKLDRLNHNINLVLKRLVREGKARNTTELADMLARDINRLGIRPAEKARLVSLARRSFIEGVDLENFRLGHALRAMKRLAKAEGLDYERLPYSLLDNSLWFPDSVGAGGPAAFDREVRNPPTATLLPR